MGFYIREIDHGRGKLRAENDRGSMRNALSAGALQVLPPMLRFSSASYTKACQSKAPQALVKVVSHARGVSVRRTMEYIARDGAERLENESGERLQGKEDIKKEWTDWREDFERAKPGTKRPPRHATHIILSAKCENTDKNARRLESAARQFLHDRFAAQGYQYVWSVHRDTQNPHVHVVLKNHNRELNRKIRIDKPDLAAMRQEFANHLSLRGIEQVAVRRMDRVQTAEAVVKGVERIKQDRTWYRATLTRIENKHKTQGVHAPAWLSRQVLQVDRMARNVERNISVFKRERPALLKELRTTKKELLSLAKERPGSAAQATLRRIGKDLAGFGKALEAHQRTTGGDQRATRAETSSSRRARLEARRQREATLSKWWERQQHDIATAQDYIKSYVRDAAPRNEALKTLNQYQKTMQRNVERSLSRDFTRS